MAYVSIIYSTSLALLNYIMYIKGLWYLIQYEGNQYYDISGMLGQVNSLYLQYSVIQQTRISRQW